MNRKSFLGISLLCVVAAGCRSEAYVREAYMAKGPVGTEKTNVFSPAETVLCFVRVEAEGGTGSVVVKWFIDISPVDPIGETEIPYKENNIVAIFEIEPKKDQKLPAGTYRVDVYLDGKFDRSLRFTVT